MKTLVVLGHREVGGKLLSHGSELPPGVLPEKTIARLIDLKWLLETDDRRSLYRLFPEFSGSSESEPLDSELRAFAI